MSTRPRGTDEGDQDEDGDEEDEAVLAVVEDEGKAALI